MHRLLPRCTNHVSKRKSPYLRSQQKMSTQELLKWKLRRSQMAEQGDLLRMGQAVKFSCAMLTPFASPAAISEMCGRRSCDEP